MVLELLHKKDCSSPAVRDETAALYAAALHKAAAATSPTSAQRTASGVSTSPLTSPSAKRAAAAEHRFKATEQSAAAALRSEIEKERCAWRVGDTVRVLSVDAQGASRRAVLACIPDVGAAEGDAKVEVVYVDAEDEDVVTMERLIPLEPFEKGFYGKSIVPDEDLTAAELKKQGNKLFKLADYFAAAERFAVGIDKLSMLRLAVLNRADKSHPGAMQRAVVLLDKQLWATEACLVIDQPEMVSLRFLCRIAVPKDMQGKTVRLPAPRTVMLRRALAVHDKEKGELQVALYLNRARCWLQVGQTARAVQDSLLAIALLDAQSVVDRSMPPQMLNIPVCCAIVALLLAIIGSTRHARQIRPYVDPGHLRYFIIVVVLLVCILPWVRFCFRRRSPSSLIDPSAFCKAYFLRARARLGHGKLSLAEADAKAAETFALQPEQLRQLEQFKREVANARRSNKRLAKEVAKWCEKAMAKAKPDAFSIGEAAEVESTTQ